jgi:hypothetical protein
MDLMVRLGEYLSSEDPALAAVKEKAFRRNGWFIPPFVDRALENIASGFLDAGKLSRWLEAYPGPGAPVRKVGIVMAGNIPAVGFHDLLCGFMSGHELMLKLSSRDEVLISHMVEVLKRWEPALDGTIRIQDMLRDADAYIATGSNNTARYFHQYFAPYPHIIRRNRTSVAVLDGTESAGELDRLSDDILLYFGLGCRNVTKIYVPEDYDFLPLLDAVKRYSYLMDDHHYRNNFDYNLSIALLNKEQYMTNQVVLLMERSDVFSRIGVLHYERYRDAGALRESLALNGDLQCVGGRGAVDFGTAQYPSLTDYADGVDTFRFLENLS